MNTAPVDISDAQNVIALCIFGRHSDPFAHLVFAAWDDGTIVWSRDRLYGGAPYRTTNIGVNRVLSVLDRLEYDGLFSELPLVGGGVSGSECTCFVIRKNGKAFDFESCHELFEQTGDCIAEHDAMTPVGNRKRFDVLARQPQNYIFSRMLWLELRRIIDSLIPDTGEPCDGQLDMFHAAFRWLPGTQDHAEP